MPGTKSTAAVAAAGAVLSCLVPGKSNYLVRNGEEVRLVQVLHRHGARTPFRSLPGLPNPGTAEWSALWGQCRQSPKSVAAPQAGASGSPLTEEVAAQQAGGATTYGPCGRGQLTQRGEEQLRLLGTWLRAEYLEAGQGQLFTVAGQELEVVSTKTSRTIFSARALLLGLLPDLGEADAEAMVKTEGSGIFVADYGRCVRLRHRFHQVKADLEGSLMFVHTRKRLLELGNETQRFSLIEAGDSLRSLVGQGSAPPSTLPPGLAEELDACGHELVEAAHGRGSRDMRRLAVGPLVADIRSRILAAVDGSSPHRCVVRSAHDVSVAGLVVALGLPAHRWPGFGSSIIIELVRELDSGEFKVRIICHDGVPGDAGAVGKTQDVVVPLATWSAVVAPVALSKAEYEEECRLPPGANTPPPHSW